MELLNAITLTYFLQDKTNIDHICHETMTNLQKLSFETDIMWFKLLLEPFADIDSHRI